MELRWSLAGLAVASFAGACSLLVDYDNFGPGPPEAPAPTCSSGIPDRPVDVPRGGGGLLFGATNLITFGNATGATPLGANLDGLCTCPDRGACRARSPQRAGTGTAGPCDQPSTGIDNAGTAVIGLLYVSGEPGAIDESLQKNLESGAHGVLVQVAGWNGEANDPDVEVTLFNIAGVEGGAATFDGDDAFYAASESFLDGDAGTLPRYVDTQAYVSGGLLVASFDFDLRLVLRPGGAATDAAVTLALRSAKLLGHLERAGQEGLQMPDAQLVGRIPEKRMLSSFSSLGFCQGSATYATLRGQACQALDLPGDPSLDGTDVPCDAISSAVLLDVRPATFAGHAPALAYPALCPSDTPDRCP